MMEWREEEDGTGGGGLTPFYGEQHFVLIEIRASPRLLHHPHSFLFIVIFVGVGVGVVFVQGCPFVV